MSKSFVRSAVSSLQNGVLIAVNFAVAGTVTALVALTLIEHFEDTEEIRTLACALGFERTDCPRYGEEMARLKAELEAIADEHRRIEGQLAGLRAIESAVDEITLFENHSAPDGMEITVGTVYSRFVDGSPSPDHHFCYLNLESGIAGESRNLHFHGSFGPFSLSASELEGAGVSAQTFSFARSVCEPFLIGER